LTGQPSGTVEPAHIHMGGCPGVGNVIYPLTSVSKGASTTILPVSLADLLKQEPFAINVHKSTAQIGVYVACGDSTKLNKTMGSAATPNPVPTPAPTPTPTPTPHNSY